MNKILLVLLALSISVQSFSHCVINASLDIFIEEYPTDSTALILVEAAWEIPNDSNAEQARLSVVGCPLCLSVIDAEEEEIFTDITVLLTDTVIAILDVFDSGGFLCFTDTTIFTVTSLLPVELEEISAKKRNEKIELSWTTASELNNRGFQVLHRTDEVDWQKIDFVIGRNEPSDYLYIHKSPEPGDNYYQLIQEDFSGETSYSKVVSVSSIISELVVYPNPAKDSIYSSHSGMVYDLLERPIMVIQKGINELNLIPGIYYLKTEKETVKIKVVK